MIHVWYIYTSVANYYGSVYLFWAVPPCRQRCCKVRFKPTIEVREMIGSDCPRTSHGSCPFRKDEESCPIHPLTVWKVMGVAFIFGILVGVQCVQSHIHDTVLVAHARLSPDLVSRARPYYSKTRFFRSEWCAICW